MSVQTTHEACRPGFWSALSVTILGAVYFATGLAWVVTGGLPSADPF
jgi:hypothetical protein